MTYRLSPTMFWKVRIASLALTVTGSARRHAMMSQSISLTAVHHVIEICVLFKKNCNR